MQACDRCHSRKTRCDRRFPQCGACEKAGAPCLHADKLRQRNLPRGYIDSLESMVQQLRLENRNLQQRLAKTQNELESRDNLSEEREQHGQPPSSSSDESSSSRGAPPDAEAPTPPPLSQNQESRLNPIAVEVGYLSLVATGETRYLGSSSGLGLASIVDTVLGAQAGMDLCSGDDDLSPTQGPRKTAIPAGPGDAGFPQLANATPFIDTYFQHTHVSFPLLHRPTFMASVKRIYDEPGYYATHLFEAFVFDMVLAIGSSRVNRFHEGTVGSSTYFALAQSKVKSVLGLSGLQALQAILLVSQHGIFSNLRDTAASMWHLVGIATRMCFELGLHLEHNKSTSSAFRRGEVLFEDEMKKRCFWCLYNLDRVVSFTLGRPVAIRDDEIDITLPSPLDDACFGPDMPINSSLSNVELSPFLHIIRIRRISGEILSTFYNSRSQGVVPISQRLQVRRRFHEQINSWMADTKKLCLVPMDGKTEGASSFRTMEWYKAVCNNAVLLLYRPSPYIPQPIPGSASSGECSDLMTLFSATRNSIESYSKLHKNRRLNYSWITLHGIFIAGLGHVYSINGIIRDHNLRHALPDALSIMEVCRSCSNILVAISERWDASRRSCEIFERVSTVVIREVLDITTRNRDTPVEVVPDLRSHQTAPRGRCVPQSSTREHSQSNTDTGGMGPLLSHSDEILLGESSVSLGAYGTDSAQREGAGAFPIWKDHVPDLTDTWPFDFPFGTDGALDNSRGDDVMTDWAFDA